MSSIALLSLDIKECLSLEIKHITAETLPKKEFPTLLVKTYNRIN